MVTERDKEIADKLMEVLTRDRDNCNLKASQVSQELSELLEKEVVLEPYYCRKGTFGNENIRLNIFADDRERRNLATFFLKTYPLLINYNGMRRDRGVGHYSSQWLRALLVERDMLGAVPFLFGVGTQSRGEETYNLVLLEDAGDISLEDKLLKERKNSKKTSLLKVTIKSVVNLHRNLDLFKYRHGRNLRKSEDYCKQSVSYIGDYLESRERKNSKLLKGWREKGESLFYDALNLICETVKREPEHVIHLDLHPDHFRERIIDLDHIGAGVLQSDLVDLLKNPFVNWKGFNNGVNKLVKYYLYQDLLQSKSVSEDILKKSRLGAVGNAYINFLKIFYFVNVIRDMRNVGFSSWLRTNEKEAYNERLKDNPAYSEHREWYLKDLCSVLGSLSHRKTLEVLNLSSEEYDSVSKTKGVLQEYGVI